MGNLVFAAIEGKDTMVMKIMTLKNILYVHLICKNLVSRSLLSKHDFRIVIELDNVFFTE